MTKLVNVVLQMREEDFRSLSSQLLENKAGKLHTLLCHFRDNTLNEKEIAEKLKVSANTYYTLKSRLLNKIQESLTAEHDSKFHLLQNVANIPNLLFNTKRDIALAILGKLERDLLLYDMPYELTNVYHAMKKLHIHTPKYYEYTQLYNKHIAYMLALDKAEDLITNFSKTYGEYSLSNDKSHLEVLLIIKSEMANLCHLYASHRLNIYRNIVDISFALFIPLPSAVEKDRPVEEMLKSSSEILESYPKDIRYKHLQILFDFLYFEYYHQQKQHIKRKQYFDRVNDSLTSFLLYNFCCQNTRFLISKIEYSIEMKQEGRLYKENKELMLQYQPDEADLPNYINYIKYLAACAFHSHKYREAIDLLETLISETSWKNISFAEIEIKLFLSLVYTLFNRCEDAKGVLRNLLRKIREVNKEGQYENALAFIKILNRKMELESKAGEREIAKLKKVFEAHNHGPYKMMCFLSQDSIF